MRTSDLIQITPAVSTLRRYPPRVNACKHASKEGGGSLFAGDAGRRACLRHQKAPKIMELGCS